MARLLALGLLLAGCAPQAGAVSADDPLLVAAASDLLPAFSAIGDDFRDRTGHPVEFSFGSSGRLAQQLAEGAPMDLYAAASAAFVDVVLDAGVGDPVTRVTYAYGRLAIWATDERWNGWGDLGAVADDTEVTTIAIANPEHAPYGLAARQAFEAAGAWEAAEPRLVFGENVTDTLRLAASGNADVAVVALSLALAADEDGEGRWVPVDDALHEPLQQDLIVTADDPARAAVAQRFADHVMSEAGRAVLRRYGLLLPGERLPAEGLPGERRPGEGRPVEGLPAGGGSG